MLQIEIERERERGNEKILIVEFMMLQLLLPNRAVREELEFHRGVVEFAMLQIESERKRERERERENERGPNLPACVMQEVLAPSGRQPGCMPNAAQGSASPTRPPSPLTLIGKCRG